MDVKRKAVYLYTLLALLQFVLLTGCIVGQKGSTTPAGDDIAASFIGEPLESLEILTSEPIYPSASSETVVTTESTAELITESATELETEAETETSTEPEAQISTEPFVYCGLVELLAFDDSFIIDQKYATTDNFTGVQHYDRELCLVNRDIVEMLITANNLAKENGLRLKIWDAYRPISVQQALHDSAPEELAAYVPAPSPYSMHARGITVDVTLCDMEGNELDMPTEFDDFSEAANSDYEGATVAQIANRELLNTIMSDAGFKRSRLEWWHFDGPNRDNYEILDVSFAEFEEARDGES